MPGSTRSASRSRSRTPPTVTSASKPCSYCVAPITSPPSSRGTAYTGRPSTRARTVRRGGGNAPARWASLSTSPLTGRTSPCSVGCSPAEWAPAAMSTRSAGRSVGVGPHPGHPLAVVQHGPHRLGDEPHPGPLGRAAQRAQQQPVVHGQVAGHGQATAHVRAEPRLQPAQLPAGQPVHRTTQLGQVLGQRVQLGLVPDAGGGHHRALGAQAGRSTGGRAQLLGEPRPALQGRRPELEQQLLPRPRLGHRGQHAAGHPGRPAARLGVEHRDRPSGRRHPPRAGHADHARADHRQHLTTPSAPCAGMTRIRFDGRDPLSIPSQPALAGSRAITCRSPYAARWPLA